MYTSWSASIVCTVPRNSVAKCPDIGATISTRGWGATGRALRKCSSVPNGVAAAASSTIGTVSPSTTIDRMPNGGRRCENAQHSSSSHSASSVRPVGVVVDGGHSAIVARAVAAHARAGRRHSADH